MRFCFKKLIFFFFLLFLLPSFSLAQNYGQKQVFFIDTDYDLLKREKILATNILNSEKAYFYVEDDFWFSIAQTERDALFLKIKELSQEFNLKIYPILTQNFGAIKTGVNSDPKITILFHQMSKEVGGYSREADNFEKILSPASNERKMIYLNSYYLKETILRSYLAHEFTHLIIFDQKENREERWLQEAIAEISPTIIGYPENLEKRIEVFKKNFKDPLLEWKETSEDYAILSLFGHYLLDQFGPQFFAQILKTKENGVLAIEKVSQKNFSEIFRNFAIANYLNSCEISLQYCYKIEKLKTLKIVPEIQFLPTTGNSVLTMIRETKDFSQNIHQFYGGRGSLKFEFEGKEDSFDITLIFCDANDSCQIKFLNLDQLQSGTFSIPNFTQNYKSIAAIIFSKKNIYFTETESKNYNYTIKISFNQVSSLSSSLPATSTFPVAPSLPTIPPSPLTNTVISCKNFDQNLKFGMRNTQVLCLQQFLKSQGAEIYPEGLITGYFGSLTLSAVKRFQQKYWQEILVPWGLTKEQATGFVGSTTRQKLNQLLLQQ